MDVDVVKQYTRVLKSRMDSICPAHFIDCLDGDLKRRVFSASLAKVELETTSYCNRRCSFCPNARLDRYSKKERMPEDIYLAILSQLREIDFSGQLLFNRYNEPLADKIIIERVAQAREYLPKSELLSYTNGDYVELNYIKDLEKAGLNRLHIMAYMPDEADFSQSEIEKYIADREARTGVQFSWRMKFDGREASKEARINRLYLRITARDFRITALDRGALVDLNHIQRKSPCHAPFDTLCIDYNGSVVPCCNIRSDASEHAPYIYGNLSDSPLQELYFSKIAMQWRRRLAVYMGSYPEPCKACAYDLFALTQSSAEHLNGLLSNSRKNTSHAAANQKSVVTKSPSRISMMCKAIKKIFR